MRKLNVGLTVLLATSAALFPCDPAAGRWRSGVAGRPGPIGRADAARPERSEPEGPALGRALIRQSAQKIRSWRDPVCGRHRRELLVVAGWLVPAGSLARRARASHR